MDKNNRELNAQVIQRPKGKMEYGTDQVPIKNIPKITNFESLNTSSLPSFKILDC